MAGKAIVLIEVAGETSWMLGGGHLLAASPDKVSAETCTFELLFEKRLEEVANAIDAAMKQTGINSPEFHEAMEILKGLLAEAREAMPETARELDLQMGRLDTEIANEKKEMSALLARLRTPVAA